MASIITIRILFYLVFLLFIIVHTIDSFPSYDLQNTINNDVQFQIQNAREMEQYDNYRRSVLWPKICVSMLKEHNYQHLRDETKKHHWHRTTRKCYPSGMQ